MDNKTSLIHTEIFNKGLLKDVNDTYVPEGNWTHARNAVNNSPAGDIGVLGNEPSTLFCSAAPYDIIGAFYINNGKWAIYSTDDVNSEIGLFDEENCEYFTIYNEVGRTCLKFLKSYPVIGVAKYNSDCTWQLYWDDGNNPSRTMNIGKEENWPYPVGEWEGVPYEYIEYYIDGCKTRKNLSTIDCDKLRLAQLVQTPCIKLQKGVGLGTLYNGSYQAVIAYSVNGIRVTDYIAISNIQPLWTHENANGTLDVILENLDTDYDEFELVIIAYVNQQAVARKIGNYSTSTTSIGVDAILNSLPSVPLEQIPIRTPAYEKSAGMYNVNEYLIRVQPSTYEDFNYQPLANKIKANWIGVEYPAEYYYKGGNKPSFLRDEV